MAVEEKQAFDYVTEADRRSQEAVLSQISRRHPEHAILAEESDQDWTLWASYKEPLWVVDPLDGTTNFIHHYPQVAGLSGRAGGGAAPGRSGFGCHPERVFLRLGRRRRLAGPARPQGEPPDRSRPLFVHDRLSLSGQKAAAHLFESFFPISSPNPPGCAGPGPRALDLAYVAAGRGEGFWEIGLKPWDMAAGILLIQEAGGLVSDFSGGDGAPVAGRCGHRRPGPASLAARHLFPPLPPGITEEFFLSSPSGFYLKYISIKPLTSPLAPLIFEI